VLVRVAAAPQGAELVVDDAGPGIPPAERERVFDRFYRRNPSASEGSGLGLAIVRTVATRHGATVALGDSPLGGLRATVHFPGALASA
jgi:two-component system OmpR family sensor kinase/two-component system sensor histidine kinase QseC